MTNKSITKIGFILLIYLLDNYQVFSQETIDKAQHKFYYEYLMEFDTLNFNDQRDDLIILQVGTNISKSYSYYSFQSDSVMSTKDGERIRNEAAAQALQQAAINGGLPGNLPFVRRMNTIVYKNYPKGQMTVTDAINNYHYKYFDELHSQVWEISDSTKSIMGYHNQLAVSAFRGRQWYAWFANEIPISDGPWKFSGLPGLIMEVYDAQKHHHFTLVGIERMENEPIVFSPVVLGYKYYGKYEKTTRLRFLRSLVGFLWNFSAIMNVELGREVFDETTSRSRPHDLLERDYR